MRAPGIGRLRRYPAVPRLSAVRRLLIVLGAVLMLAIPLAPAATAAPGDAGSTADQFLRISLDSIDPSTVSTTSSGTVTAHGTLENIGDRPVRNIAMRLQRGDVITSSAGLGDSLSADPNSFEIVGDFVDVTEQLAPGASVPFTLRIALSADNSDAPGLDIDTPGVYPILINVNGTPEYGNAARLDDARTLLPVMGLPENDLRAQTEGSTDLQSALPEAIPVAPDGSVPPDVSQPVGLTLLWPIAAPASLAPGVTGGGDETVRLMDNGLRQSLEPGGRLDTLLTAMEQTHAQDGNTPLTQSICLAIDPDLLVSVQAMTGPYLVSVAPRNPTGPAVEGTGTAVAENWLTRLQTLASTMCVVATPFAHVDIAGLVRVSDPGLSEAALAAPADIVDTILKVKSVRGLTIATSGVLDDKAADVVRDTGSVGTIVSASAVSTMTPTSTNGEYPLGNDLAVQTFDPALASALAAMGTDPRSSQVTPTDQRAGWLRGSNAGRRQTALGAMMFSALSPSTLAAGNSGSTQTMTADPIAERIGRGQILMPPPTWSATADDTRAVLSTVTQLLASNLAVPRPLESIGTDLTATATAPAGAELITPVATQVTGPSLETVDAVSSSTTQTWDLQESMVSRSDVPITPQAYMAPLREDLLRAMASVSPQDQPAASASGAMRTSAVSVTISGITNGVSILGPGGHFTLASERSPLLLVIRNDLPVAMRVRLAITAPAGMTIGNLGVIEIPAQGTRQLQLPTRADLSKSMTVQIGLVTSSGVPLGSPIELSVHSNAYGQPLFIITICAGVLLVLLAGRRLWHRFRGEPDPADLDRPEPDEHERLMADSRALHSGGIGPWSDSERSTPERPGSERGHPRDGDTDR
ncbi:DUF6049 family protein [Williamsia sp.]|uniref:DUF6049 family protein n=1 Tax=Williamsia sp. TaxID=1872085 RepID=UPI002F93ECA7